MSEHHEPIDIDDLQRVAVLVRERTGDNWLADMVEIARSEITRLRDERRWIPVTEGLPEISELNPCSRVLGAVEGGKVFELEYEMNVYAKTEKGRSARWKWNGMICPWRVTHWQPLPPPPGEGEVGVENE